MRRRYPRARLDADLFQELIDVLLLGWGAPMPADDHDDFRIFFVDLAAAWRTHHAALLTEWRKRGGIGAPWAARQFGNVQ